MNDGSNAGDFSSFKGRNGRLGNDGSNARTSKLDEAKVLEIKKRLRDGEAPPSIAKDYPVTATTIKKIRDGFTWNRVKIPEGE